MRSIKLLIILILLWGFNLQAVEQESALVRAKIKVFRSPTCSCCSRWITHIKDNSFTVKDYVLKGAINKSSYGIPQNMRSCHTAIVDGYIIEGHVPAQDIINLLKLKPDITGISVPNMPVGTPGMEMGDKKDSYKVFAFSKSKPTKVFNSYNYKQ